jgi:large subunit ribosomal protein L19
MGSDPKFEADSPLHGDVTGVRISEKYQEEIMDALQKIAQASVKENAPEFHIGDTVKVSVNIREGERERIQMFEGTVIARRGSGVAETFTVRRLSYGVGVERVFPLHSPNVVDVKVVRRGKVRRSKLYYLRDRVGKAAKVKEEIRK